ncbi:MAG: RNA polymerase factor sigma-54 [Deltaproteobacteria bacterium]
MLKQKLSQKLVQKLSPKQMQLMKLIQLPSTSLVQRIKEELESNPALEEDDGLNESYDQEIADNDIERDDPFDKGDDREEVFELDDYINEYIEDDPVSYKQSTSQTENSYESSFPVANFESLLEHLEKQIGHLGLETEEDEIIARQIIGTIDDDGYLRRDIEDIIDDILFLYNIIVSYKDVERIIKKIQRLDPPGIAARDLQETLIIQLKDSIEKEEKFSRSKELAMSILYNHFDTFSKKHYTKLEKNLFVSKDELKEAIDEIIKLNPKPASGFSALSENTMEYIVPDFIIENRNGELELSMNNSQIPELHINDSYLNVLKTYKESDGNVVKSMQDKSTLFFIKQKIDSAKWFIDAIQQRQQTLYKTMYTIMQFQYDYFLTGDRSRLKPMILKDISDITGFDISTISRVASSKYVQTEFGINSLKEFFSESITREDGEEASTIEVKEIIIDMIKNENKQDPYSDEDLRLLLIDKGYNLSRRTIAKYREHMNIPVGRLRREI